MCYCGGYSCLRKAIRPAEEAPEIQRCWALQSSVPLSGIAHMSIIVFLTSDFPRLSLLFLTCNGKQPLLILAVHRPASACLLRYISDVSHYYSGLLKGASFFAPLLYAINEHALRLFYGINSPALLIRYCHFSVFTYNPLLRGYIPTFALAVV